MDPITPHLLVLALCWHPVSFRPCPHTQKIELVYESEHACQAAETQAAARIKPPLQASGFCIPMPTMDAGTTNTAGD